MWLYGHRLRALWWPACKVDLPPIENVQQIIKTRRQRLKGRVVQQNGKQPLTQLLILLN